MYLFLIFIIFLEVVASDPNKNAFLSKCIIPGDSFSVSPGIGNGFVIPANLLRNDNHGSMTIKFRSKNHTLNCNPAKALKHTVYWGKNETTSTSHILQPKQLPLQRNFYTLEGASHTTSRHFLDDATFFNGTHYFRSDGDYCVYSYHASSVTLHLCPPNTTEYVQIPKCCANDEAIYLKRVCRKLSQNQVPWHPELYSTNPDGVPQFVSYSTSKLSMFRENMYSKCQHIKPPPGPFFQWWSPTGMGTGVNDHVKLVVTTTEKGTKEVVPYIFYNGLRKWLPKTDVNYCVEGTYIENKTFPDAPVIYTGLSTDFVIYWCYKEEPIRNPYPNLKSWLYATTSLISCLFLFMTVIIYLLLLKNHKLPGLTVLMYSIAMLNKNVLATASNFIRIFPNNNITGVFSRGWLCYLISVTRHYFYFASLLWMTILNIQYVCTFRKTYVIARNSKRIKDLLWFCSIAWGIPFVLVAIFCTIEVVYRDPMGEVPVPGYGDFVCYVARAFRGYYVYTPMAIILAANVPLMLLTLRIFWKARGERRRNLEGKESQKSTQVSEYSAAFFLRLFGIMGGTDLVSFLTWYHHNPTGNGNKAYWVMGIEALNNLTPIFLFGMFCLNKGIRKQLTERFKNK